MPRPAPHHRLTEHFAAASAASDALTRRAAACLPLIPLDLRTEAPGPDGIRHQLVAHVRALIAAGAYEADDRFLAAETRLLDITLSGP